jgi:RibD C-terminal domain
VHGRARGRLVSNLSAHLPRKAIRSKTSLCQRRPKTEQALTQPVDSSTRDTRSSPCPTRDQQQQRPRLLNWTSTREVGTHGPQHPHQNDRPPPHHNGKHCEAGRCGPAQPCAIGDGGVPDEEVLDFINAAERDAGTYLYGRTMCEMMIGWETDPAVAGSLPRARSSPRSGRPRRRSSSRAHWSRCPQRTRIERSFVRASSKRSRPRQVGLNVSSADVAASAWRAGVIDECHVFVAPMLVGSGKRMVPDNLRQPLETGEMLNLNDGLFSRL